MRPLKDALNAFTARNKDKGKGKALAESSSDPDYKGDPYHRLPKEHRDIDDVIKEKTAYRAARNIASEDLPRMISRAQKLVNDAGEHKLLTIADAKNMLEIGIKPALRAMEGESGTWTVDEARWFAGHYLEKVKGDRAYHEKVQKGIDGLKRMSSDLKAGGLDHEARKADDFLQVMEELERHLQKSPHEYVEGFNDIKLSSGKGTYSQEAIRLVAQDKAPIEAFLNRHREEQAREKRLTQQQQQFLGKQKQGHQRKGIEHYE
jgi:hypothetical protein